MFYFDGKEYASFIEDKEDELLIALEYDNKEITSITCATYGYYDITFEDGMTLNAISEIHIKRKN
tara:strand:- start:397 stop:591 length:195 start_codon:yes stop_codon:yes gene_type:complete